MLVALVAHHAPIRMSCNGTADKYRIFCRLVPAILEVHIPAEMKPGVAAK